MRMRRIWTMMLALVLALAVLPQANITAQAASGHYITVDLTNQIVTVYRSENVSESGIVRQMICSTGKSTGSTPVGTYTMPAKRYATERTEWYYISSYSCYVKWASRIVGSILFHSVVYDTHKVGPTAESVNALGSVASHGCVRLREEDARWIAQNCPSGTRVKIYRSSMQNNILRNKLLDSCYSSADMNYSDFKLGSTTLLVGSSGMEVRELQNRLNALGYACGTADGVFNAATESAVKAYQANNGLSQTGQVTPEELDHIITADSTPNLIGTAVAKTKLSRRAEVSSSSVRIDSIPTGTKLDLLEVGSTWCRVYYDGKIGYVTKSYLTITYGAATATPAPTDATPGPSASPTASVTPTPTLTPTPTPTPTPEVTPLPGTIGTAKAKITLSMRAAVSASSKRITAIPKGAQIALLQEGSTWCRVQYGSKVGYVTKAYLNMSISATATPTPATATPAPATATPAPATATPAPGATPTPTPIGTARTKIKVTLRADVSPSSKRLGAIPKGKSLILLQELDECCRVQYDGKIGYVTKAYLTLYLDAAATPAPVMMRMEAPAPEAPITEVPATEVPTTEAPATGVPATEAPVTEAPATEAPATEAPITEAPATEVPATEVPATKAPATEAPVAEAPAAEAPAT